MSEVVSTRIKEVDHLTMNSIGHLEMNSLNRAPAMPPIALSATEPFNSANTANESLTDAAVADVKQQQAKGTALKRGRNAGERIQRR